MGNKIQLRRGFETNFGSVTLSAGEPAFVIDTGKLYVGDGVNKILINALDKPAGLTVNTDFTKIRVNDYGQVTALSNLSVSDIPNIPSTKVTGLGTAATVNTGITTGNIPLLDESNKLPLSTIPNIPNAQVNGLGSAALVNTGTSSGNVPVLDVTGKLSSGVLPPVAITDTFVVDSQEQMLALTAEVGDIAVRTDTSETYILKTLPVNVLANWVKLLVPTDTVLSVNGYTGAVVLKGSDIALTGYSKQSSYSTILANDTTNIAIGKLERNFDNFAPLVSPTFTGTPLAPTPTAGDNSTKIATTAYVDSALLVIDGGTF